MLDLDRVLADTPNPEQVVHFNNAGCSLSPKSVTDAVVQHLMKEQSFGGYEAATLCEVKINAFYNEFAQLLNCQSDEIAYIENASRAWELALHSLEWSPGDEIITAENEYVSNYLGLLHLVKQHGVKLVLVPCDAAGLIDLGALESAITKNSKLIAVTHIASQRGDIQPAVAVGEIASRYGLLYLLDACQSVGQVPLDTKALQCHFLCGTGRKYLRGPRGTGFLFASERTRPFTKPVFLDNHAATWTSANSYSISETATRYETWERNIAAKIGLGEAVRYANQIGLESIQSRIYDLASKLNSALTSLSGVTVLEKSAHLSGIVTFQKQGINATETSTKLRALKMNTSVSKHENARLDLDKQQLGDVVRASIHYYNTLSEIESFVEAVGQL